MRDPQPTGAQATAVAGAPMIAYKVLRADGTPYHGGIGRWHLPTADGPGEWMPPIDPVPCTRGYHLCRDTADLLKWLGPTIWVAEVDGKVIHHHDKVVVERARLLRKLPWDAQTARKFAADCAERALPVYEAAHPGDDRPRRAVEVARAYGDEATRDELSARAASWAASRAAARAVSGATELAARAAAWAAWAAAKAATMAVSDAAELAAWAAAWAARAAANPTEAAWAAAWAADAARGAAWGARSAWAARAAEDAERTWQAARLAELLGIGGVS